MTNSIDPALESDRAPLEMDWGTGPTTLIASDVEPSRADLDMDWPDVPAAADVNAMEQHFARLATVPSPMSTEPSVPSIVAELGLTSAIAEGAHMAATAHLVRGGVLPSEVNPVAGFTSQAAGLRASLATDASAHTFGQSAAGDHAQAVAIPTGVEVAGTRPLSPELPAEFRAQTLARRTRIARQGETPAAARKREAREAEALAQATLDGAITLSLQNEDGEYPHGCFVGWRPSGEISYAVVRDAAIAGGVTPPAERSNASVASAAVQALAKQFEIETVKRGSAWRVYRSAGRVVAIGESVGDAVVNATLTGDVLTLEGPADLCATVDAAWRWARSESILTTAEVTAWLGGIVRQWRGTLTCYGRYLPPSRVPAWLQLAGALHAAGLPVPARPAGVMTRACVREEIACGLESEVAALISTISKAAGRATTASKTGVIGDTGASTLLAEIEDMRVKLGLYELLTGPLSGQRDILDLAAAQLAPLADARVLEMS